MNLADDLLYKDEVFAIIGAGIEVHKILGPGFLESVYEAAFVEECRLRDIPIQEQVRMTITYKDMPIGPNFIADIVAYGKIIVELKTVKQLGAIEAAQVLNYLKATKMEVGLLVNFSSPGKLEWKRFVMTSEKEAPEPLF
jgi:GxxExxY protein